MRSRSSWGDAEVAELRVVEHRIATAAHRKPDVTVGRHLHRGAAHLRPSATIKALRSGNHVANPDKFDPSVRDLTSAYGASRRNATGHNPIRSHISVATRHAHEDVL